MEIGNQPLNNRELAKSLQRRRRKSYFDGANENKWKNLGRPINLMLRRYFPPTLFAAFSTLASLFFNFPLLPSDKNACLAMKNSIGLFAGVEKRKRNLPLFSYLSALKAISFQSLKNKTRAPLFLNGKFAFGRNWMAAEF